MRKPGPMESVPGAVATGSSEVSFHSLWISTGVRAGENDYRLGGDTIPNQIRESTNDCSANVAMDKLINKRGCFESTITRETSERNAAPSPICSGFVPDLRLGDIQLRGATDLDF